LFVENGDATLRTWRSDHVCLCFCVLLFSSVKAWLKTVLRRDGELLNDLEPDETFHKSYVTQHEIANMRRVRQLARVDLE
jgi:hypothetical protein